MNITVFHYEITLPNGACFDTKYCFSNTLRAINKGKSLKKEHAASKVRIENNDNSKTYFV